MELLQHQKDAASNLGNGKILWGSVGTGKSQAVLSYYMEHEAPRDIYVITPAKKRDTLDWVKDASLYGIGQSRSATLAGVLTVDSWNNIHKYVDVEDAFFIFDEQRLVGYGSWVKSFLKIAKKNGWVLLTATPGDTWMDYVPVFIANGLYRNATQFKREHVIYAPFSKFPKIVRYIGVPTLEKYRNMLLVEMPYLKHTTRVVKDVTVAYDEELFKTTLTRRWNPYENRPIKDISELFRVMRKIVNSDPDRLRALRELIKDHPKLIVFYNFDYELEILRRLSDEIEVAEWNGHKKQQIPNTDKWVYLVQYISGAEGWNCISTNAMIFYSLTYSYKNLEQAQGRIDRLNSPYDTLYYYILVSNSAIDKAVRKSLKNKKLFNERSFGKKIFKNSL